MKWLLPIFGIWNLTSKSLAHRISDKSSAAGDPTTGMSKGLSVGAAGRMWGVRIIVLSDTHAPRFWKSCPPAVASWLRQAELILHAGDVCTASVLDELAEYAPVRVVLGNNDAAEVSDWGRRRDSTSPSKACLSG
jgi:hypothetical protein